MTVIQSGVPRWLLFLLGATAVASFLLPPTCVLHAPSPFVVRPPSRIYSSTSLQSTVPSKTHVVDGIECVEIRLDIPVVGQITILEATAQSQEALVDMALDDLFDYSASKLNAGDPYGAVLWPAASAIASYMLTNITDLVKCSVLELGTGTGLVSLAASLGGASSVTATDYEAIPLSLLEYAAQHLNGRKEEATPITTALLDMRDYETTPLPPANLVVAADIMYEPVTGRAMARRAHEALLRGSRVLVGDSPGRAGRPAFLEELDRLGIEAQFQPVQGWTCAGQRHELICGKESLSVSETPRALTVDILYLDPDTCFRR